MRRPCTLEEHRSEHHRHRCAETEDDGALRAVRRVAGRGGRRGGRGRGAGSRAARAGRGGVSAIQADSITLWVKRDASARIVQADGWCSALKRAAAIELEDRRTHPETIQRLRATIVDVNAPDAAPRARVHVEEPDRAVVRDGHDQVRNRRPVHGVPEARVEAVDRDVRVVCGDARRRECALRHGVVSLRDWCEEGSSANVSVVAKGEKDGRTERVGISV